MPHRASSLFLNPHRTEYQPSDRDLIGCSHAVAAQKLLDLCSAHQSTPLLPLTGLAAEQGVAEVYLKAEWRRMGLGSFKALGGAYVVALLVMARAGAALGRPVLPQDLQSPSVRAIAERITVACASAGNHGLSVAAGARAFGVRAVVFLNDSVSESFALRLRDKGAVVRRAGATYEQSMARARSEAEQQGWDLVSDSSWPGYLETPLDVMRGYAVLFAEAADTLDAAGGPASHVFVQAGVGGLAAAAAGYLRDRWGEDFKLVVVEPQGAPCLRESVRQRRPVQLTGGVTTLGRLDCKEPSLLAYELLSRLADGFVLVSDAEAERAAARLSGPGAPVSACGAAGAAGLDVLCADAAGRGRLGLNARARVLLIGTEAVDTPDSISNERNAP